MNNDPLEQILEIAQTIAIGKGIKELLEMVKEDGKDGKQ